MKGTQTILLTGGAGYIGSHTLVALAEMGMDAFILDNFSNSNPKIIERLRCITGQPIRFQEGDVTDVRLVTDLIAEHQIHMVVHLAGHKSVGESVGNPLKYFEGNICGLVCLIRAMQNTACRNLIFSSSATVYGPPASVPIKEDFPRSHTNPYGYSKLVCEDMLNAVRVANADWRIGILRYFNPIGAHPSGLIGEAPRGTPNNLMPYLTQVAVGTRPFLSIYGTDFDTPDGTGVRDYIHVQDLAEAHVAAVRKLLSGGDGFTVNVGTGCGYSVLEVLQTFERIVGRPVPHRFVPRRAGDVAQCYADVSLSKRILHWEASRTLADMCEDAWRWQVNNPGGYL